MSSIISKQGWATTKGGEMYNAFFLGERSIECALQSHLLEASESGIGLVGAYVQSILGMGSYGMLSHPLSFPPPLLQLSDKVHAKNSQLNADVSYTSTMRNIHE